MSSHGAAAATRAAAARASAEFGRWLRNYRHMLRFAPASARSWIAVHLVLQMLLGAALRLLYGFYIPHRAATGGAHRLTGTPALFLPDRLRLAPEPDREPEGRRHLRLHLLAQFHARRAMAATATLFTAIALPGLIVALALSA
ncbi:MAG: hypothetical protein ACLP8S_05840 [Solirubrobacteraceae bacterium]